MVEASPSAADAPRDRAAGVAMVGAWGDALGARYEAFRWAPGPDRVRLGRGLLAWRRPGWWTDDTDMALGILLAARDLAAAGRPVSELADATGRAAVLRRWLEWHDRSNPLDAGLNTWRVLHKVSRLPPGDLDAALEVSRAQLRRPRRGGGNGAVMRTAVVALAYPGDARRAWDAAAALAELTHPQDRAVQAAGLWTVLCERALTTGDLHPRLATAITVERAGDAFWADVLDGAGPPGDNGPRGWAPTSVADAWWCVRTAVEEVGPAPAAAERGLRLAVSSGQDPDTTAAIAGGLLGALCGAGSIVRPDRDRVHGGDWTGARWTLDALGDLARTVAASARP